MEESEYRKKYHELMASEHWKKVIDSAHFCRNCGECTSMLIMNECWKCGSKLPNDDMEWNDENIEAFRKKKESIIIFEKEEILELIQSSKNDMKAISLQVCDLIVEELHKLNLTARQQTIAELLIVDALRDALRKSVYENRKWLKSLKGTESK